MFWSSESNPPRSRKDRCLGFRIPRVEILEDRTVPSACSVTNLLDAIAQANTSSGADLASSGGGTCVVLETGMPCTAATPEAAGEMPGVGRLISDLYSGLLGDGAADTVIIRSTIDALTTALQSGDSVIIRSSVEFLLDNIGGGGDT